MKKNIYLKIILVLSILGLLVSIYLVKSHFNPPTEGSFCDFGEAVSCSLVNTSTFSKIFNVPVSIFGSLWFIILILLSWKANKNKNLIPLIFYWAIVGFLFVIYLIIAEIILKSICPACTAVHVISLTILILSFILYKNTKVKKELKSWLPWLIAVIVLFLIPLLIFNINLNKKDYSEFTKCIDESGMKMYGSFRCGVCAKTRALFGDAFKNIEEIECHPQGKNPQVELCLEKEVKRTPTWILEKDGKEISRNTGFTSPEKLSEMTGCSLELIKDA